VTLTPDEAKAQRLLRRAKPLLEELREGVAVPEVGCKHHTQSYNLYLETTRLLLDIEEHIRG